MICFLKHNMSSSQRYLCSRFGRCYEVLSICRSDGVVNLFPIEPRAVRLLEVVSSNLRRAVGHRSSKKLAGWVCEVTVKH